MYLCLYTHKRNYNQITRQIYTFKIFIKLFSNWHWYKRWPESKCTYPRSLITWQCSEMDVIQCRFWLLFLCSLSTRCYFKKIFVNSGFIQILLLSALTDKNITSHSLLFLSQTHAHIYTLTRKNTQIYSNTYSHSEQTHIFEHTAICI